MNDIDNTHDHGLTTEQIAAVGTGEGREDAQAPAGDQDVDDNGFEDDGVGDGDFNRGNVDDSNANFNRGNIDDSNFNDSDVVDNNVNDSDVDDSHTAPIAAGNAASVRSGDRVPDDTASTGTRASLLEDGELQSMTARWKDIQSEFVDEPSKAVQEADALVAELMQRLAVMFATERAALEERWAGDSQVSTEDLRQGLRRYRSFFERLLAA